MYRSFLFLWALTAFVWSATSPGFYVEGRFLKDKNGDTVILKGLNYTAIWMDPQGTKIAEMEKTGANAIRIVWSTGGSVAALDTIITRVINNHMIPIPEVHDLTGKELSELPSVVSYWTRSDVQKVLKKHEEYLILNIANEVGGTANDSATYVNNYAKAVDSLRAHGINVTLMIDADQWGQNIDQLQRSAAPLTARDPLHNLLFSIHTWWPYEYHSTSTGYASPGLRIIGELQESVDLGIPLVIGEFSKISPSCVSTIPYDTLLTEAAKHNIGWMAWGWMHGNNDGKGNNCYDMDMTDDGNYSTLHDGTTRDAWAKVAVDSLQASAVRPQWIVDGNYTTGTISIQAGEEMIVNGTFDSNLNSWTQGFWGGKATASSVGGQAVINITDEGAEKWDLQFSQGVAIQAGVTYILSFEAKSDVNRDMQVLVKNPSPYKGYLDELVSLTSALTSYSVEFTPDEDNAAAELSFQLGAIGTGSITFDNVSLQIKDTSTEVYSREIAIEIGVIGQRLEYSVENDSYALTIFDLNGQRVEAIQGWGKGTESYDFSHLNAGVYFVQLQTEHSVKQLKINVQ